MSYSRLKLAAFTLGAMAVCLAASAETPGLERIGCCGPGADAWTQAAEATPAPETAGGETGGAYIERGPTPHDWRVHVAGLRSPKFGLPPAVDRAMRRALGKALPPTAPPTTSGALTPAPPQPGEANVVEDRVTRWSFWLIPSVWGGSDEPLPPYLRRCREHKDGCHGHPPPPPPAVPEPGVWVLVIVGLAAVGGAIRRRRRPAQAVR
jgi:hypothetical protein